MTAIQSKNGKLIVANMLDGFFTVGIDVTTVWVKVNVSREDLTAFRDAIDWELRGP